MSNTDAARQVLDDFLAAVRARKKRQAVGCATEAFREKGRGGGDGAARLFDVLVGRRAQRGRMAPVGKKVAAEIWSTTTNHWPSGKEPSRRPLVVHLAEVDGAWFIDDAELNKRLRGRREMRGAADPGAPALPATFSAWLAAAVKDDATPSELRANAPIVQLKQLFQVGSPRPTMVKRLNGSKSLCVQFLLEGPGFGRHSALHWGEFERVGQSWTMRAWRRGLAR